MEEKHYYRRNLPHWHPSGVAIFLTCRLYGSLPEKATRRLSETQRLLAREIDLLGRSNRQVAQLKVKQHKKLFAKIDTILDKAESGPRWFGVDKIADMVEEVLLGRCADMYRLWAYVVMVNHLHLLLRPRAIVSSQHSDVDAFWPLSAITRRIKGYTAREGNLILERTGQPFWQPESFDHWPRDEAEFFRIVTYIEDNPVKAGLVQRAEEWRWSSAAERKRRGWSEIRPLT